MMKIVVYHLGKHRSVYKFPGGGNWADHMEMYKRDVSQGFYRSCELWKKTRAAATGERGGEVWELIERFPQED